MQIRCLVVDDEKPAADELVFLLSELPDVSVAGVARSAREAVEEIKNLSPDLVFLDINMPGRTGFYVVEAFSGAANPPLFIFCTAYDQYAVKAFEEQALDYILKPFSPKRLATAVCRARERLEAERLSLGDVASLLREIGGQKEKMVRIAVEHQGRTLLLDPEEVVFCQAEEKRVRVFTSTKEYMGHGAATLDSVEEQVAGHAFFRVHRASLVHLKHIREVTSWYNGKYLLTMDNASASEVVVSRNRVKGLKEKLGL